MHPPSLQLRDEERSLTVFDKEAFVDSNGVVRWKANNVIPFSEVLVLWHQRGKPFNLELSIATRKAEDANLIRAYRIASQLRTPDQVNEARAEARAALGPGIQVRNASTGEEYTT